MPDIEVELDPPIEAIGDWGDALGVGIPLAPIDAIASFQLLVVNHYAALGVIDARASWKTLGLIDVQPTPLNVEVDRAWAFTLHGHTFYVLNSISGKSLVYDITTGQWHHWFTGESDQLWNMLRGVVWKERVIAADGSLPKIWELDPYSQLDEEETIIKRAVTGFQAVRGDRSIRQGALRMTASVGTPDNDSAPLRLRFSDDGGHTWSNTYTVELEAGNSEQVLEFRSLGRLRTPGRLWELEDDGGLVRIEGLDSDMDEAAA